MSKTVIAAAAITTLLGLAGLARGEVIYTEDFDGAGTLGFTTEDTAGNPQAQFSDGVGDYFIVTDGSDIHSFYANFSNQTGNYFAAQHLNGDGAPSVLRLRIEGIDVTDYENLSLSIGFATADSSDGMEDWDDVDPYTDWVHANLKIDDSGDDNPALNGIWWVGGNTGGYEGAATRDLDFDGVADGPDVLDTTFTTFTQNFAQTGTTAGILITMNLNGGDEDIAFDNITLSGDRIVPEPAAAGVLAMAGLALLRRRRM